MSLNTLNAQGLGASSINAKEKFSTMSKLLEGGSAIKLPFPKADLPFDDLNIQLLAAINNDERITIMNKHFNFEYFRKVVEITDDLLAKDESVVSYLKQKGRTLLGFKNIQGALRASTLALAFAKPPELGQIYLQRSYLLFKLKEFEACLEDSHLALSLVTSPEEIKFLEKQESDCEVLMALQEENVEPENAAKRDYAKNVLFNIQGSKNEKIPSASEVVEIRMNNSHRGLFVNQHVKAGSVLIVEDPFVYALDSKFKVNTGRCGHCLKRIINPMACPNCVFVLYCSEECRLTDFESTHKLECPCLPFLHGLSFSSNLQLTFKAILKAGSQEFLKLYHSSPSSSEIHDPNVERIPGCCPESGKYLSDSYSTVLNLISHIEDDGELSGNTWMAIAIVEILDCKTDFFSQAPAGCDKKKFKDYVASKTLTNILSIPFNSMFLCNYFEKDVNHNMDKNVVIDSTSGQVTYHGVALYPLISLMNHSCHESVTRVNLTSGTMTIIAACHLHPGEELTLTYGYDFTYDIMSYRQQRLSFLYIFHCSCIACKYEWPLVEDLTYERKFRCPKCTDDFSYPDFEKITLEQNQKGIGACPHCGSIFKIQELVKMVNNRGDIMADLEQLTTVDKIPIILERLEYYQRLLAPPSIPFCLCQDLLWKLYCLIMSA